jgi:hypothetical protein
LYYYRSVFPGAVLVEAEPGSLRRQRRAITLTEINKYFEDMDDQGKAVQQQKKIANIIKDFDQPDYYGAAIRGKLGQHLNEYVNNQFLVWTC